MEKDELIEKVCSALRSYIAELEWGEGYSSNESYRAGQKHADEVRKYIEELKKL